jgi:hypothetical protein
MDRPTADAIVSIARSNRRRIACRGGEYRTWVSSSGAEIWLHYPRSDEGSGREVEPIDDLKGITVFQRGASSIAMRVHRRIAWKENPLDGVCIASLPASRRRGRSIPFVFEQVGFAADAAEGPYDARVQVAGLAHCLTAYPTESEYLRALPSRRLVARGSIVAMEPDEVADMGLIYRTKPGALWLVTGVIKKTIRLQNPLIHRPYHWLLVATDRGEIDVVANPGVIAGDISRGHSVQAVVSMVGRVLESAGGP